MSNFLTIGHSNHPIDRFVELTLQHGVEVIVDTRSSPFSRYAPQFDQRSFQSSIEAVGLKYIYLGSELGGRPANPEYYDGAGRVVYGRLREDSRFQVAIVRLETGIARFRVALACGEEDPAHCHRRLLIGRVLTESGHTMLHIRGDGRVETDPAVAANSGKPLIQPQPALFAELDEDQWKSTASVLPKKVPANSSRH